MLFTALVVSVIIAIIGTIRIIRNRDWRKAVLRKAAARDERVRELGQDVKVNTNNEIGEPLTKVIHSGWGGDDEWIW